VPDVGQGGRASSAINRSGHTMLSETFGSAAGGDRTVVLHEACYLLWRVETIFRMRPDVGMS
jgi:hypothetical protein